MAINNKFRVYGENSTNLLNDSQYDGSTVRTGGAQPNTVISSTTTNTALKTASLIAVAFIDALGLHNTSETMSLGLSDSIGDLADKLNTLIEGTIQDCINNITHIANDKTFTGNIYLQNIYNAYSDNPSTATWKTLMYTDKNGHEIASLVCGVGDGWQVFNMNLLDKNGVQKAVGLDIDGFGWSFSPQGANVDGVIHAGRPNARFANIWALPFENDGTTVKEATHAGSAGVAGTTYAFSHAQWNERTYNSQLGYFPLGANLDEFIYLDWGNISFGVIHLPSTTGAKVYKAAHTLESYSVGQLILEIEMINDKAYAKIYKQVTGNPPTEQTSGSIWYTVLK